MGLKLTSNNWELKADSNYNNSLREHYLGVFSSPFIIAQVESSFALPDWRKGGYIAQGWQTENGIAYGKREELLLSESLILEFLAFSGNSYELYYFTLPRLTEVRLKVWEYKGDTVDSCTQELIEALQAQTQVITTLATENLRLIQTLDKNIHFLMSIFVENLIALLGSTQATATNYTVPAAATGINIAPANPYRRSLSIRNTGTKSVAIGFTEELSVGNNYITLNSGAIYEFNVNYIGDIWATGLGSPATSAATLIVTEFT
jgi:hypothetical protein